jgi:hypothetical protein
MRYTLLPVSFALSCAATNPYPELTQAHEPEVSLPNGSPQTAAPLPLGIEVAGMLGCGQTAWYQVIAADSAVHTLTVHGQALENALGATVSIAFVDANSVEMGRMMLPVFARSPNWDPREQAFVAPHPGTYYARATVDPNGCQRVNLRVMLR